MSDHTQSCGGGSGRETRNPQLPGAPEASPRTQTTLKVAGMDCADEVETVENALKPLPGVREVRVNLMGGKVVVAHDHSVTPQHLIQAIVSAGLAATPDQPESGQFL